MYSEATREKERLAVSIILAAALHGFVLLILMLAVHPPLPEEKEGPVFIELLSTFQPVVQPKQTHPDRAETITETVEKSEDKEPKPIQKVKDKPAVQEKKAPSGIQENQSVKIDETIPPEAEKESSLLAEGSLPRLDQALKDKNSSPNEGAKTDDTAESSHNGGKDPSASSSTWEDNATRQPLIMKEPKLPGWVSEEGLRLTVILSVELSPEGYILVTGTKKSSGFTDVDEAVREAVSHWKYLPVNSSKSVKGKITFITSIK